VFLFVICGCEFIYFYFYLFYQEGPIEMQYIFYQGVLVKIGSTNKKYKVVHNTTVTKRKYPFLRNNTNPVKTFAPFYKNRLSDVFK